MAGKVSSASEHARVAYQKSVAKGKPMKPIDLALKFGVALSTIYRAPWWKNRNEGKQ